MREGKLRLLRYGFPILLVVLLSALVAPASGDPLFRQFKRADMVMEETNRIHPLFGRLIVGDTEISTEKISTIIPILQVYADSTPSNPFLSFALANAHRILGQEDVGDSLFAVARDRAAHNAGFLLVLASRYEDLGLTKHEEATYDALLDLSISSGYTTRPAMGYYFHRRALERLKEGERSKALAELEWALKFDPHSLSANLLATGLSIRMFKGKAVGQMITLYRAIASGFFVQQLAVLNGSRAAELCFMIAAIAFLVGITFRNLPSIQHRFLEFLPSRLDRAHRDTLAWAIVSIPVLWLWSMFPLLIVPIYLFVAWLPAVRKERFLIFMFFAYLILIPYLMKSESKLIEPLDPHHKVSLIAEAQQSGYDPSLAAELKSHLAKDSTDFDLVFSLGLLQKRGGNFEEAISLFNVASRMRPRSSAVRNNLGNTYFALGDYDTAMEEYTTAAGLDPGSAAPRYNMSQTYSKKLMLPEASEELNRALKLDYTLVSRFRKIAGDSYNIQVIDIAIAPSHIWQILFRSKPQGEDSAVVGGLFGAYPRLLSFTSIGLLVLSILVGFLLKNVPLYITCIVCGVQACDKCLENEICPRCTKKMVVTDSTSMRERLETKLRDRAYKYRAIKSLALSAVLPGAGHVFLGATWKGATYSVLYSIALVNIGFRGLFIRISPFSDTATGSIQGFVALGAMVVIYVFCIRSTMRTLRTEEM